jgi:NADH:ubiquinone oxidoreductase subunit 5 (subunit L)/multisubunit Na+/H+ antiporter MnhA subunit
MYIFIIIFPFIGFLLAGGLGKYFGREGSAILSTFGLLLTLITALLCFYEVALCNTVISINIYT